MSLTPRDGVTGTAPGGLEWWMGGRYLRAQEGTEGAWVWHAARREKGTDTWGLPVMHPAEDTQAWEGATRGVAQGHRCSSGTRTQVSAGKLRLVRWFNAVSRQRPSGIRWCHQEAGQPDSSLSSLPYTSQPHVCSEMWGWTLHIPFSPKRVLGDGGVFTGEGGWVLGIPSHRVH